VSFVASASVVQASDLATWRRGRTVLGYIHGKSTAQLTPELIDNQVARFRSP
jgi:hypothetical protein